MELSAYSIYGTPRSAPATASSDVTPGIATAAGPAITDDAPFWHPHNPLFIFGALLAAAAGLVGFASSGRVGPASASVSLGKTK